MSDWIKVLEAECQKTSQQKVAAILKQNNSFPSTTTINQVIKGKYPGRTDRLQALVEGKFMSGTVDCPVVGPIPSDQCIEYQGRPYAPTNPTRIQLYKACRGGCPHSNIKD